ncbi:uncharacterized protein LOC131317030 [Rhododendron vialii]|uniref:uncharacterized protein LOC131317030 n=1 Tax=Rhododendron vialii TaxID=182163 RepID=UPI00265EF865|nr:uncharacterized protein LOC131317030 [Rhododendron vialii]
MIFSRSGNHKLANKPPCRAAISKRQSGLFKKLSELCTLVGYEIALVVFSPGLFKKASKLCTLVGCDIAIVVFSSSEKLFLFGHCCIDASKDMLVNDGGELFSRFNSRTVMELKRELLGWLRHLQDGLVAGILCEIVSILAAQMLPVGKWPELEGFLTCYIQKIDHVALDSTLLNLLDELAQHVPTSYLEAVPRILGMRTSRS